MIVSIRTLFAATFICLTTLSVTLAADIAFKIEELKTKLGVGYAVRLIDMNGDKKLDIAIVDAKRIIWLENPTWAEHTLTDVLTTPNDNVCFAPADIDGDGKLDFAIGSDWQPGNTKSGGYIGWISPTKPDAKWEHHFIAEEPTVHRMQFADLDGNGKSELIVVPLKGPNTTDPKYAEAGVRILSFTIPTDPRKERWPMEVLSDELHVCHNFQPLDFDGDGKLEILVASFEGVHLLKRDGSKWKKQHLGAGDQASKPYIGASEIKLGRLGNKAPYIATIEPWHGNTVVVYTPPQVDGFGIGKTDAPLWTRHVLDKELQWGHAVWCANLDADADEELIIGIRDNQNAENKCGLRIYDPVDVAAGKWNIQRVDPSGVAIEDLAAGDLNGDGKTDIVAVGRATHNVKIYWQP